MEGTINEVILIRAFLAVNHPRREAGIDVQLTHLVREPTSCFLKGTWFVLLTISWLGPENTLPKTCLGKTGCAAFASQGHQTLKEIPSLAMLRHPFFPTWNASTHNPPENAVCIHVRHGDKFQEMTYVRRVDDSDCLIPLSMV